MNLLLGGLSHFQLKPFPWFSINFPWRSGGSSHVASSLCSLLLFTVPLHFGKHILVILNCQKIIFSFHVLRPDQFCFSFNGFALNLVMSCELNVWMRCFFLIIWLWFFVLKLFTLSRMFVWNTSEWNVCIPLFYMIILWVKSLWVNELPMVLEAPPLVAK